MKIYILNVLTKLLIYLFRGRIELVAQINPNVSSSEEFNDLTGYNSSRPQSKFPFKASIKFLKYEFSSLGKTEEEAIQMVLLNFRRNIIRKLYYNSLPEIPHGQTLICLLLIFEVSKAPTLLYIITILFFAVIWGLKIFRFFRPSMPKVLALEIELDGKSLRETMQELELNSRIKRDDYR